MAAVEREIVYAINMKNFINPNVFIVVLPLREKDFYSRRIITFWKMKKRNIDENNIKTLEVYIHHTG